MAAPRVPRPLLSSPRPLGAPSAPSLLYSTTLPLLLAPPCFFARRVSDLAFGRVNATASAWASPPVEGEATTLISRLAVEGLGVTRSARGNTAKQIIMLTPEGEPAAGARWREDAG